MKLSARRNSCGQQVIVIGAFVALSMGLALPQCPVYGQLAIGVNFVGGEHAAHQVNLGSPVDGARLAPDDVAGFIVRHANWNNLAPFSETLNQPGGPEGNEFPDADGSASNLRDGLGNLTTIDIAWEADNTFAARAPTDPGVDTPDEKLMDGYLDLSGSEPRATVTLTEIPFDSYDIYVYVGSDGSNRTSFVDLNQDPSTAIWVNSGQGRNEFRGVGDYQLATATTQGAALPGTNVVLYQAVQGATAVIGINLGGGNVGIHGLQIVQSINPSTVRVDLTTGQVWLVGGDAVAVDINGWELRSTSDSLLPGNLAGFAAQNLDPVDTSFDADTLPGTGPGERWEVINAEPSSIVEGFLSGSTPFSSGRVQPLGRIFNPAFGEDPNLVFEYTLKSGLRVEGSVEFVTLEPSLLGDFDGDGDADGSDFLSWQRGFGIASGALRPQGDANGDGSVTSGDLAIWAGDFGSVAGSTVAALAVPEPIGPAAWLVLLTLGRPRRR
jgi:hypothetical protein